MGRLIISTQITLDGAMEPITEWFNPKGSHGLDGQDPLAASSATTTYDTGVVRISYRTRSDAAEQSA